MCHTGLHQNHPLTVRDEWVAGHQMDYLTILRFLFKEHQTLLGDLLPKTYLN